MNPSTISYPIPPLYVITEHWVELPVSHRKFPRGIYFTYGNDAEECSNYRPIALISHASKVMLKMLQARLQQYVNCELPDVQAGFRKGRGTRDQIANICWIIKKAREFQKNIYFCFIDYAKAFDSVDHNKLWKILKENSERDGNTRLPDLPLEKPVCRSGSKLDRSPSPGRTGLGTTDWFQIGKEVCQGCILLPCLFNFYAEYIMRNAGLESRLPGEISITSDMQMTPPLWHKVKRY